MIQPNPHLLHLVTLLALQILVQGPRVEQLHLEQLLAEQLLAEQLLQFQGFLRLPEPVEHVVERSLIQS